MKKILPIVVTLIISTTGLFVNERYVGDEFVYNLLMTLAISGITTAVFRYYRICLKTRV